MIVKVEVPVNYRTFGKILEILVKNRTFGQKSNFWSKIGILFRNRNFNQKSNFL